MEKIENHCVCCEVCYNCGRDEVKTLVCDECKDYADYETSEGDFCEHHFEVMLNTFWEDLTLEEKAKMLGITIYSEVLL